MMIPNESPGAAWAAAIARQRERESGAASAGELIGHAWCGSDLPARARDTWGVARLVTQQKGDAAAVPGGKRKPPCRGQVRRIGKFRHHGRERAALERLFHREQRIDRTR